MRRAVGQRASANASRLVGRLVCTRRAFFLRIGKAAGGLGAAAAYDRFGPALFGQAARPTLATVLPIFRAFGKLVIPVDEDPGWETFEPGISEYALDVYIRQVFALGNQLAFDGLLAAMNGFNEFPPIIGYGPKFLNMNQRAQGDYLSNVLISAQDDGVQFTATDLDIEISESAPALVERAGATSAPAHTLYEFVRRLPDGAQVSAVSSEVK